MAGGQADRCSDCKKLVEELHGDVHVLHGGPPSCLGECTRTLQAFLKPFPADVARLLALPVGTTAQLVSCRRTKWSCR
jgi:hypothetical protein